MRLCRPHLQSQTTRTPAAGYGPAFPHGLEPETRHLNKLIFPSESKNKTDSVEDNTLVGMLPYKNLKSKQLVRI